MRDWDNDLRRPRQRASAGKQPLVVRHTDDDVQLAEVLERLERLESRPESSGSATRPAQDRDQLTKWDARTIAAIGAILLSIASYFIQDARSASRLDAEIEATELRVTNLEKIAAANTEARVRSEVELGELRQGQAEIKDLLRAHENETRSILHQK